MELRTPRLRLICCGAEELRAALAGRLGPFLGLEIDSEWPSGDLVEVLPGIAEAVEADPALAPWGVWVIVEGGRLIGDIGYKGPPDDSGTIEIGYGLVPSARGCGFAVEAVRALVSWALARPGVMRVVATVEPGNAPSERVLERSGFRRAGLLEGLLLWENASRAGLL